VDFPLNGPLKLEVHSVAKTHTWAIPKNLEEVPCQYQIFTILGEAYIPSILNQGIPGLNNKHLSIGLIPRDLWSDLKKIYISSSNQTWLENPQKLGFRMLSWENQLMVFP